MLVVSNEQIHSPGTVVTIPTQIFLFSKMSRTALGPTQPPIQLHWDSFPGTKQPVRVTTPHLRSGEVMSEWN